MSRSPNPVVASIIETQIPRAESIAAAMIARLDAGTDDAIRDAGRVLAEIKQLQEQNGPLVLEREMLRVRANQYMAENCTKTMWTAIDLRELNPALADEQLQANTKAAEVSDSIRALHQRAQECRTGAYRAIGKMAAAEVRDRSSRGEDNGPGLNFVAAYLAGGLVRQQMLGEQGLQAQANMLQEFFSYSINSHGKKVGVDFFENSSMAEAVCKGLGMKTAREARQQLYTSYAAHATPAPDAPEPEAPRM